MGYFASENPDEMPFPESALFSMQRKKYNNFWEIITCNPSIYTMDHPDLTVWNIELVLKGLKIYMST